MTYRSAIITLILIQTLYLAATNHIVIVIHGTWAANEPWSKPGGNFFQALEQSIAPGLPGESSTKLVPFVWAGNNSHECRELAALVLCKLIESYEPATIIDLVAHSHGSNVGIIASQFLDRHEHRIRHFYALGTPVNAEHYMPNMNIIQQFYNLFSLEDYVQPVMGIFERIFPPHKRISNIRILINDKGPNHADMHNPLIGTWLFEIPLLVKHGKPGLINFSEYTAPHYEQDKYQAQLLEKNYAFQEKVAQTLSWLHWPLYSTEKKERL